MCGRYTLTRDEREFARRLGLGDGPWFTPRYNIAPTQEAPVFVDDSGFQLKRMHWGLIPSWAKESGIGSRLINARSETVAEKLAFRKSFERRRCLVPTDGFYEWKKVGGGKQPVRIVLKSRGPFMFAGLWDRWRPPEGEPVETFTILTTEANDTLAVVHHRMPVIVRPEDWERWVRSETSLEELKKVFLPFQDEEMEFYNVSPIVNNARHETPECIAVWQPGNEGRGAVEQTLLALPEMNT